MYPRRLPFRKTSQNPNSNLPTSRRTPGSSCCSTGAFTLGSLRTFTQVAVQRVVERIVVSASSGTAGGVRATIGAARTTVSIDEVSLESSRTTSVCGGVISGGSVASGGGAAADPVGSLPSGNILITTNATKIAARGTTTSSRLKVRFGKSTPQWGQTFAFAEIC